MKIIIIGGHGKVALLAAPMLVAGGHSVTSVIRKEEQSPDIEETGAAALVSDVEHLDADATCELVRGYDAVLFSAGAGGGSRERTYAVDRDAAIRVTDAAVTEGVGRFVMVSYVGAGRDDVPEDNPFHAYAEAKAQADGHLRGTSLNWTILGPGQLTLEEGSGRIEYGDHVAAGETSRANVAELAVGVVGRTDLGGVTINFRDGNVAIWEAMESLARRAGGTPVAPLREGTAE
ncbi:MAG: NAD(P)H-binding protein [Arachnia sp.]